MGKGGLIFASLAQANLDVRYLIINWIRVPSMTGFRSRIPSALILRKSSRLDRKVFIYRLGTD
jgi:hypothetical protein